MFKKLGLLVVCTVSAFAMHSIELNINDEDLEITAKADMGQFSDVTEPDTVFIGARFLHSSEDNLDLDDYAEVSFLMQREVEDTGFSVGLGIKANYTKDFVTIPVGVELAYKIPVDVQVPMKISTAIYYAPKVLSMQDAKNFLEYRVQFEAEVIKNANVFVGYRNIDTDYDRFLGDVNYNKSAYIGFKFSF